ncbi:unnamed protein product [Cuscuta epithymum]|uniref:Uncharacterized protein n=1 Tax=Cuscuta epithymum TaxID=186058 RepID=A0AAV0E1V5_9ASTE|nr:unnamed protein product [Cuscuta epithymum]
MAAAAATTNLAWAGIKGGYIRAESRGHAICDGSFLPVLSMRFPEMLWSTHKAANGVLLLLMRS